MKYPEYCVAIRTLGTAGDKYQQLLDSLKAQYHKPKKILVYIAEGYPLPKETIGIEEYIRCPKGMIAQRALPFKVVDTDYVLFCDDDLYLPPNLVERMFEGLNKHNGDCVAANVYNEDKMSLFNKIGIFVHSFITPHKNDGWAIHIKRNNSYSYNNHPIEDILKTESAPGACCLCKMSVYKSIHFEDEKWMDQFSFAAGDDNLFYYKMHLMGHRILSFRNSGIVHLDARAGVRPNIKKKMYYHKMILFIMWYRIIYEVRTSTKWRKEENEKIINIEKWRCIGAFCWRCLLGVLTLPLEVIHYREPRFFIDYFRGLRAGWKYVHSKEYKVIPAFNAYT